jgi:predicted DNA-binding transcriptional regulator AlpA
VEATLPLDVNGSREGVFEMLTTEIVPKKAAPAVNPEQLVRIPEAARILGLSPASIRRYLTQRRLRRFKIGNGPKGPTLVRVGDVLALVREAE